MTEKKCRVCGRVIPDGHVCLSCGDYDEQQRFAADKPKTNGDRIRQMADAELAAFLNDVTDCCSDGYICEKCPLNSVGKQCNIVTFGKWLEKKVNGNDEA